MLPLQRMRARLGVILRGVVGCARVALQPFGSAQQRIARAGLRIFAASLTPPSMPAATAGTAPSTTGPAVPSAAPQPRDVRPEELDGGPWDEIADGGEDDDLEGDEDDGDVCDGARALYYAGLPGGVPDPFAALLPCGRRIGEPMPAYELLTLFGAEGEPGDAVDGDRGLYSVAAHIRSFITLLALAAEAGVTEAGHSPVIRRWLPEAEAVVTGRELERRFCLYVIYRQDARRPGQMCLSVSRQHTSDPQDTHESRSAEASDARSASGTHRRPE